MASLRLQVPANFLRVACIAHAENLQPLTILELKLPTLRTYGGPNAAVLAQEFRNFRSVLSHVATADQARHHEAGGPGALT